MQNHTIKVNGALVFWSLSPTDRAELACVLNQHGWVRFIPPVRSDTQALRAAMEDAKGKDQMVQALKSPGVNGYEVVTVNRGDSYNSYQCDFRAWVERDDTTVLKRPLVSAAPSWRASKIQDRFDHHKKTISPSSVGKALTAIAQELDAVAVRPGMYWLPADQHDAWTPVAAGVERAGVGNSDVHMVHTAMTEDTLKCVRDALVDEVTRDAQNIRKEIDAGELGHDALENRKERAGELYARVDRFAELLGERQAELDVVIHQTREAAVVAALKISPVSVGV